MKPPSPQLLDAASPPKLLAGRGGLGCGQWEALPCCQNY